MGKLISGTLFAVGVNLLIAGNVLAQPCECPLKEGRFKDFTSQRFSHHNPKEGAVIISPQADTVRSVLEGRVLKIFNHAGELSVLVLRKDTTIVSYRYLSKVFVNEGANIRIGDPVGMPGENENNEFGIAFAYRKKLESVNPESILKCKK